MPYAQRVLCVVLAPFSALIRTPLGYPAHPLFCLRGLELRMDRTGHIGRPLKKSDKFARQDGRNRPATQTHSWEGLLALERREATAVFRNR